jgi:hypothetical protein
MSSRTTKWRRKKEAIARAGQDEFDYVDGNFWLDNTHVRSYSNNSLDDAAPQQSVFRISGLFIN